VSERERDFERESGGGRESKCVCVCVFVCVWVQVFFQCYSHFFVNMRRLLSPVH